MGRRQFVLGERKGYLIVHRSSQLAAAKGDPIRFSINPAATYLFDADGKTVGFPTNVGTAHV